MIASLADISDRVKAVRLRRIHPPSNHPRNRASGAGDECERALVYRRTHGAEATTHGPELQALFDLGREHESWMVRLLEEAGLPLLERERFYEWPEIQTGGSIDGKIPVGEGRQIVDIKSSAPHIFDTLKTPEDVTRSRHFWIRKYAAQMDLYLAMDLRAGGKSEEGGFLFVNKSTGALRLIPHRLDANRLDATVSKLQRVNAHVAALTLPERIDPALGLCERCPFARICLPDSAAQDPTALTTDADFIASLTLRAALKFSADEFKKLDEAIKDRLKVTEFSKLVAGDFAISKRHQFRKEYTVKAGESDVITITSLKGATHGDE